MTFCLKATLVLILLLSTPVLGQYVPVPLDHRVYPLLTKGETLGLFEAYALRVLPITREEAQTMLAAMEKQPERLSAADKELLVELTGEFTDPGIGEPASAGSEIHAYRYDEGTSQIFVDIRGIQEFVVHRGRFGHPDENVSWTTGMGGVRARFGDHVFVAFQARNSMAIGAKDQEERYDVTQGETQVNVGSHIFTDQAEGTITGHFGPITLTLGRSPLAWGSGLQEQFGLSKENEPMDQVRFALDFERFRFSYVHANLQGISQRRFLAAHRLDVLLWKGVQLGAYETIVYGERGAELAYLNPFLLYHFMEHQLGDLDNNTFGVDLTAIVAPGVRLLAEVFVDDLSFDYGLGTYWGNKLAYMGGVHWVAPFGVNMLELFGTYTRIDPFVYTHHIPHNIYSHYGRSLGSDFGPNAERWYAEVYARPLKDLECRLTFDATRKGRGDLFTEHMFDEGLPKRFLKGTLEHLFRGGMSVRYQFSRDMFAGIAASYGLRENAGLTSGLGAREVSVRALIDIDI